MNLRSERQSSPLRFQPKTGRRISPGSQRRIDGYPLGELMKDGQTEMTSYRTMYPDSERRLITTRNTTFASSEVTSVTSKRRFSPESGPGA